MCILDSFYVCKICVAYVCISYWTPKMSLCDKYVSNVPKYIYIYIHLSIYPRHWGALVCGLGRRCVLTSEVKRAPLNLCVLLGGVIRVARERRDRTYSGR